MGYNRDEACVTLKPFNFCFVWQQAVLSFVYCRLCSDVPVLMLAAADLFLWRNKRISGGVLAGATATWLLFEVMGYHLLTLLCHCLILTLAILFLWSNAATFINK
jgi:hypothetical protein